MIDKEKAIIEIKAAFDFMIDELEGTSYFDKKAIEQEKNDIISMLKEQPQIVRCKDCKYGEPGACGDGVDCDGIWHDNDWFCADGEHKEGQ